uniref:Pecanex-like protein n=1 Tax=Strongyloides papillosus TaxID=174720 RepID=A0A0N5BHI7_STREA
MNVSLNIFQVSSQIISSLILFSYPLENQGFLLDNYLVLLLALLMVPRVVHRWIPQAVDPLIIHQVFLLDHHFEDHQNSNFLSPSKSSLLSVTSNLDVSSVVRSTSYSFDGRNLLKSLAKSSLSSK